MNENEKTDKVGETPEVSTPAVSETPAAEATPVTAPVAATSEATTKNTKKMQYLVGSIVIVGLLFAGLFYALEKEGRSSTTIFSSVLEKQNANKVVATVNGKNITNAELETSMKQFVQIAEAQGIDTTDPSIQTEIRTQALEVLINTELLKQVAAATEVEVTDEELEQQLTDIETQIGGAEQLAAKMAELDISEEKLQADIRSELMIKKLLEAKFAEEGTEVTTEEIQEIYDAAVEAGNEVPPIAEVVDEIEAQVKATKEQAVIDEYLAGLKEEASIEIK